MLKQVEMSEHSRTFGEIQTPYIKHGGGGMMIGACLAVNESTINLCLPKYSKV